jgi:EAL domain-containing protein (putative c-di-GMP-specific phosphodiesterase class I)/GGDEF domain-containing protein
MLRAGRLAQLVSFGSARPTIRGKAVALAALAVAPWPICFSLPDAILPHLVAGALCAVASALSLHALARTLRSFDHAAKRLKLSISEAGTDLSSLETTDDMEIIVRGVAQLSARVDGLQHRWFWKHPITGLPTRESLIAAIADDLKRGAQASLVGAIRFADYNRLSAFDPATADVALKRFSERLAAGLGRSRPLAQVDRDCFAIWFRGMEADSAVTELQAICYALGAEIVAGEMTLEPEIEVATARYPTNGTEAAALVNHALVSLAKPGATNKAGVTAGNSAHIARERFALEQDLRHAIDREQLEMAFQPVVDISRGALVGAEALLRWRHPQAGMVSPACFIPILEDANLIDEIGRWTLNAACREARRWQRLGLTGLKIAVNLSATQLRDPGLKQMIQRTLERHQLAPQVLELELTETAATEDAERTFALFGELRKLGVSLAIDDFGSGYSSLSYLKNLPFDKLKIDREFVVDVHLRKDSQAICRSLIELTRGLGLEILAEGVESRQELEMLRQCGCRIFQGFYFSEPVSSEQFVKRVLDPSWRNLLSPAAFNEREAEKRKSA